ncbi:ATP-binding protein [Actinomadura hibisca]|uniref:ATP-binding protein n=1 Tax=Actinomadura hibisca TaxID=68565 RepID=UPI00082E15AD|nr:LuxR family transcriptional regulator [Actinomadura hibisca]
MPHELVLERETELEALRAAVAAGADGGSGFLIVSGSAGVGKTLLLGQARRLATESGLRVLSARCTQLERDYAFSVVRQLFEHLLMVSAPDQRETWLSGAARDSAGVVGVAGAGSPSGDFSLLHSLFWLTSNICQDGPLVLLVDDLHWADEASLRLLAFLQPRLEDLNLLVVGAMRPAEQRAAVKLLDTIIGDPSCTVLEPGPLSAAAAVTVLAHAFERDPDPGFTDACHCATAGNPLLLSELARGLATEGVEPVTDNTSQVVAIGTRAVARRVSVELGRLPSDHTEVAEAVAVLGRHAHVVEISKLTGLDPEDVVAALASLHRVRILQPATDDAFEPHFDFVHPLMAAGVYEAMDRSRRIAAHSVAAHALADNRARAEEVAAHLLHLPARHQTHGTILRHAADQALERGAPEAAHTYLRHALTAPMSDQERLELLSAAARAAVQFHLPSAIEHMRAAMSLTDDPRVRAELVLSMGFGMLWERQVDEAVALLTRSIEELPDDEDDLRRGLEAILLDVPFVAVGWTGLLQRTERLRALPATGTLRAAMLDAMIACVDCYGARPSAITYAHRALNSPELRAAARNGAAALGAYFSIALHDLAQGADLYDSLHQEAQDHGVGMTLVVTHMYRGMTRLRRGELAAAEEDLLASQRLSRVLPLTVTMPVIAGLHAETLLEQGRAEEARAMLARVRLPDPLPQNGVFDYHLIATSMALRAEDDHARALTFALAAGERCDDHGNLNPTLAPWRTEAAHSLRMLDRTQEALDLALEELELARRWGGPFAIGRALRVVASLRSGEEALDLLVEARQTLLPASARLELAKTEIDLGAVLRRRNDRQRSRPHLTAGLDLAAQCGAARLVESARTQLHAIGARPRRTAVTGVKSLTPSELRAATLAAEGFSNREVAQRLFVTTKTVEVHLSNAYRKLGISRRDQLGPLLDGSGA